jgi:hypothetical protein
MDVIRHAALNDFPTYVVGTILKGHLQVLLGRNLRLGGHLSGSIAWRAAPEILPSSSEIKPFDAIRAAKSACGL